jgi:hypothetical protein
VGSNDLRVHPGEVVIDVVLLLICIALRRSMLCSLQLRIVGPTGASIHCRNFCSSCAQPCTLYPEEAQQPAQSVSVHLLQHVLPPYRHQILCCQCILQSKALQSTNYVPKHHVPNTEDIAPKHGFASGLFGRRTRSFGSGGRGRWVTDWTELPCGFGTISKSLNVIVYSVGGQRDATMASRSYCDR